MKKSVLFSIALLQLFTLSNCKSTDKKEGEIPIIDVAGAMENASKMSLSMLGSSITYIPLELTDSSMITDVVERMNVTNEYVTISNRGMIPGGQGGTCMVFDRKSGSFLNTLGHPGQDPTAFSNASPVYDSENKTFAFPGSTNKLVVYEPSDEFKDHIPLPVSTRQINSFIFSGNDVVLNEGNYMNAENKLFRINLKGEVIDSLRIAKNDKISLSYDDIHSMQVVQNNIGTLPGTTILMELKNGNTELKFMNYEWIWNAGKEIHFYEAIEDTIFNYTDNSLEPIYKIETGGSKEKLANKDFINQDLMFFQAFFESDVEIIFMGKIGIVSGNFFAGKYDKISGKTIAGNLNRPSDSISKASFDNDIDGFAPITISCMTEDGNFAGLLAVDKIKSWIEENPDYIFPENLRWITEMSDDANPLLVIVSK